METIVDFGKYDEVLFLVDISGSMVMEQVTCVGVDRFTVMKEAAQLLVDYLPEETRAGLASIGGDCGTEPTWWVPTDSMARKDLKWELQYLNSDGTTPLLTTLVRAPELFSDDPNTRKSIFFISDGENICSVPGLDICDWADRLPAQNISINVLTFLDRDLNNSGAFAEYACLTDRSGGQVRYLDPLSCTVDDFGFDLADRITFELPALERVKCFGEETAPLWAVYPEKGK
jgi:Mg-chelatase subunit ChlD